MLGVLRRGKSLVSREEAGEAEGCSQWQPCQRVATQCQPEQGKGAGKERRPATGQRWCACREADPGREGGQDPVGRHNRSAWIALALVNAKVIYRRTLIRRLAGAPQAIDQGEVPVILGKRLGKVGQQDEQERNQHGRRDGIM